MGKEVKAGQVWVVSVFEFAKKFPLSAPNAPFGFGQSCANRRHYRAAGDANREHLSHQ